MPNITPPHVHCPTCHKPVAWTGEEKWRPFCSERCKMIDLGDWIDEKHRIVGEPVTPDNDDIE